MNMISQCQELKDLLDPLDEASLHYKKDENTWSIMEIAEHLLIVETAIARIIGNNKGAQQKKERFLTTDKIVSFTENRERKFMAPEAIRPKGMVSDINTALTMISENRRRLQSAIEMDQIDWHTEAPPHPFAGPLSKKDWLDFMPAHMQRHIDQIKEVIQMAQLH